LKGVPFVAHHKTWVYLSQWLGLREVATLEPKPGIPPSSAHLAEVLAQLQREPAKMVVRSAYEGPRPSEWLAQRAHIPAVELPLTVGGSEAAKDLFSLFDDTLHRLLSALR
jgi:zinc/manganese transport system substrate-binding protein